MFKNIRKNQGFTFIELAVVIMISGSLMLLIAAFLENYAKNIQRTKTIENLSITDEALAEYYGRFGVYPCPADPTLGPGDALYGIANCRNYDPMDTSFPLYDPESCINMRTPNIECTQNSSDDRDQSGNNDVVLIGVMPFRTLANLAMLTNGGLTTPYREIHGKDGYNRLLTYAVTEVMTNTKLYSVTKPVDSDLGAIAVIDENGNTVINPQRTAHYVTLSHGDNGRGGYTPAGQRIDNCNVTRLDGTVGAPFPGPPSSAPTGTDTEIENCDFNDAIFVTAIRNEGAGGDYSDDIVQYRARTFRQYWKTSIADPNVIYYDVNLGNVGVGVEVPTHKMHLKGDLVVDIQTEASLGYCEGGVVNLNPASNCLDPAFLGGGEVTTSTPASGRNVCPPGQAAYAIGDEPDGNPSTNFNGAELICRPVEWTPIVKTCAPISVSGVSTKTFLRGISNLGNILCCTYKTNVCAEQ